MTRLEAIWAPKGAAFRARDLGVNLEADVLKSHRVAWTGGDTPDKDARKDPKYRFFRSLFFRESLRLCGGLDLWKCAGTGAMERARLFWGRASYDAWRTIHP